MQEKQARTIEENQFLIKSLFVMKMDDRILALVQQYQKEDITVASELVTWLDSEQQYKRVQQSSEYDQIRRQVFGPS